MPYAGEHSCRLISPSEFEEFRRQNNWRQVDGKRVDAVFGIKDGKTELQALRYPKDNWTTADARQHCSGNDGILFEPASAPQIREGSMTHIAKFIRPEIKVVDKAAGIVNAVVSSESIDRDGDIIRQSGWDLTHFKAHPILLSSHNYRGLTNQIGEWTQMDIQGDKLVGEAKYYIKEGNPEADWGFRLASRGRAAFSVGFVPDMSKAKQIEANGNLSYEFNGQELLEVSQVTVPSNADALQSLKGIGLHPELDSIVTEILDEIGVEEEVVHLDSYPSIRSALLEPTFVYLLAEEISNVVGGYIRTIVTESLHTHSDEAPVRNPKDIVREIIYSYKEGR